MNEGGHMSDNSASTGVKRSAEGSMDAGQKKMKVEENPVSRVLHIRNIPRDVSESEIIALGTPFGRVTNILYMKNNQQALLELEDESSAEKTVNYYTFVTPTIGSQPVYIQFSKHKELVVSNPSQALTAAASENSESSSNTVLHVTIEHLIYPVTVDILHQIFSKYGTILKIVTFTRSGQYQALVQYQSGHSAEQGKKNLDGQNIYTGCNTLRIKFSKLTNLNVKYNNEKSRDYTRQDLPSVENGRGVDPAVGLSLGAAGLVPLPFGATAVTGIPALLGSGTVLQQGIANLHGLPLGSNQHMAQGNYMRQGGPNIFANLHGLALGSNQHMAQGNYMRQGGSVVFVSNLDEEQVSCDDLFILFGHYGDVHRVKILFNKKDSALIQFADGMQAQTAQQNLNGIRIFGKEIRVSKSKHTTVNMPRDEDVDRELTKDFSDSPLHRFKKPGSKNFQNIFPPIKTLHLSNIPEETTGEELEDLFGSYGAVANFRFFPKDKKMALMQMSSVEEACQALMKFHNFKLSDTNHLRVSFAKNEM
ncbi:polypyrimidine tract-binding protein 1-like isoform X1 [Rhopilema esculentum]|uniref:polypyrimidine tract-binding protein 1-like isoform X1 n=1 Tax=Rhopilema esculentum TaxID=499914 RepID=UPI0031D57715